jgi:hypothetical protein
MDNTIECGICYKDIHSKDHPNHQKECKVKYNETLNKYFGNFRICIVNLNKLINHVKGCKTPKKDICLFCYTFKDISKNLGDIIEIMER